MVNTKKMKFGDVFTKLSNTILSRDELNYENGEIKNIHYGDVLIKFGDCVDVSNKDIPYINDVSGIKNSDYLVTGDIVIADTAEDSAVGKVTEIINDSNIKVLSGLHTYACRPKIKFEKSYLGHYLNSESFRKQLYKYMQGVKVVGINYNQLCKAELEIPQLSEQKRIADIFNKIDICIDLLKNEQDMLKRYKKGIFQEILEKKAASNNSTWKKIKLSDVLEEYNEKITNDGSYEHVSLTKEGVVPKTERYERDFLVTNDNKKYRITHLDDICYNPANLKFGVICRNKYGNAIFSPIYVTFKVKNGYYPAFIEELLIRPDFYNYALKYQQGTVYERMAVSPEDLLKIMIDVPDYNEQVTISKTLEKYDKLINNKAEQLNTLISLKKGLMQQLF